MLQHLGGIAIGVTAGMPVLLAIMSPDLAGRDREEDAKHARRAARLALYLGGIWTAEVLTFAFLTDPELGALFRLWFSVALSPLVAGCALIVLVRLYATRRARVPCLWLELMLTVPFTLAAVAIVVALSPFLAALVGPYTTTEAELAAARYSVDPILWSTGVGNHV